MGISGPRISGMNTTARACPRVRNDIFLALRLPRNLSAVLGLEFFPPKLLIRGDLTTA
jgi:hypothetical protein